MSKEAVRFDPQRLSSTTVGATSIVLAAAHGRLNQRTADRALADLAEVVADNDAETMHLVTSLQRDLALLERRVIALEAALVVERSKNARPCAGFWNACRRARAWLCARLGRRD